MPVTEALSAILAGAEPLAEEMVALDAAYHRTLARDLAARRTQPPQAMSAMDGYAVRSADASKAGARFKVIGEIAAGRPFDRAVGANEAVRIFTGGVIPDGADGVVILTEWNEFRALDLARVKALLKTPLMVDLRNIYRPQQMAEAGFTYVSVGRGPGTGAAQSPA